MPTIEQIRAARALLGWSQHDLADNADLSQTGIARIENGTNKPNSTTIEKITSAFDRHDITFIDDSGVKKRTNEIRTLKGQEGFKNFIFDVYDTIKKETGEICVSNVDEKLFDKWQGPFRDEYLSKMERLQKEKDFTFKILTKEGDDHHVAKYAEYKSLKAANFGSVPFYIYGTKTAMILFEEDDVAIYIINNREIANAQRKQFEVLWKVANKSNNRESA